LQIKPNKLGCRILADHNKNNRKMKRLLKAVLYAITTVLLMLLCIYIFHFHPEIQFAFLIPGLFLILFSAFLNDFATKTKMVRGK